MAAAIRKPENTILAGVAHVSILIMFSSVSAAQNFIRTHQSLKSTPALKAGIASHKWGIEDMVDLVPRRAMV